LNTATTKLASNAWPPKGLGEGGGASEHLLKRKIAERDQGDSVVERVMSREHWRELRRNRKANLWMPVGVRCTRTSREIKKHDENETGSSYVGPADSTVRAEAQTTSADARLLAVIRKATVVVEYRAGRSDERELSGRQHRQLPIHHIIRREARSLGTAKAERPSKAWQANSIGENRGARTHAQMPVDLRYDRPKREIAECRQTIPASVSEARPRRNRSSKSWQSDSVGESGGATNIY
jgi:hypothetical protein